MGFDFLRDRLLKRRISEGQRDLFGAMLGKAGAGNEEPVQGELHFMLVDEADSILIDEARTPLIISALPGEEEELEAEAYRWAAKMRREFVEDEHYDYDHKDKTVELTLAGRRRVRELPKPDAMDRMPLSTIYEHIERAIKVAREMFLDRQYVVRDGEIVIVDEFTGRLGEGRKWRAGIHQAVEAKEGVEITFATNQAARITVQDFFLRYNRLAGMTGTASTSAGELHKIYKCRVVPVPTNRPPIREKLPTLVFGTARGQVAGDHRRPRRAAPARPAGARRHALDRQERDAVAICSTSAASSTPCSTRGTSPRKRRSSPHAGQQGKVTVATNMAGRGTDIRLGPGVHELGGLHVICTELHESQRIDRQLIGRCGRQGDPGTYRQFLALDDEILLTGFGPKKAKKLKAAGRAARRPRPRLAASNRSSTRPSAKSNAATSATARCCSTTKRNARKCSAQMSQDPYLDTPG